MKAIQHVKDEEFDSFLREAFPEPVEICWHEFDPVDALKRLDPELYRKIKKAWLELKAKPKLKIVG